MNHRKAGREIRRAVWLLRNRGRRGIPEHWRERGKRPAMVVLASLQAGDEAISKRRVMLELRAYHWGELKIKGRSARLRQLPARAAARRLGR
jgi:hypothetical protein